MVFHLSWQVNFLPSCQDKDGEPGGEDDNIVVTQMCLALGFAIGPNPRSSTAPGDSHQATIVLADPRNVDFVLKGDHPPVSGSVGFCRSKEERVVAALCWVTAGWALQKLHHRTGVGTVNSSRVLPQSFGYENHYFCHDLFVGSDQLSSEGYRGRTAALRLILPSSREALPDPAGASSTSQ